MFQTQDIILPVLLTRSPLVNIDLALEEIALCQRGTPLSFEWQQSREGKVMLIYSPRHVCLGWITPAALDRPLQQTRTWTISATFFHGTLNYGFSVKARLSGGRRFAPPSGDDVLRSVKAPR